MADISLDPAAITPARQVLVAETELQAGALGFWAGIIQAVTHIAPGLNILLGLTFIVTFAGVTAPIAYLLGGIICLFVGVVLTQLAKEFNGAGGYFLYISHTIGPRWGWITTWFYFLYDPLGIAAVCAYTGQLVQDALLSEYGWHLSWYITFFVLLAAITAFTLFGVALSARVMLVLATFEIGVFTALAISGLLSPGPGGLNLTSFDPSHIPSANGLWLGVIFSILALSGFESIAPLAEETTNPRRNLPIVIVGSVAAIAIFYTLVNWGVLIGMGTSNLKHYLTAANPLFDLGHRLWHGAWVVILVAAVNSALAVCIAIQNATTRVIFGMGRAGALPHFFSQVHPRWKTPWVAILFLAAFSVVFGLVSGGGLGPVAMFGVVGIIQTLGLIIVYIMGNIGAGLFYGREKRKEFNWLLHGVIPLVASALLAYTFYENVNTLQPLHPTSANDWAPTVVVLWALVGVVILLVMRARGQEEWLFKAGQAAHERPETAEELAHAPAL